MTHFEYLHASCFTHCLFFWEKEGKLMWLVLYKFSSWRSVTAYTKHLFLCNVPKPNEGVRVDSYFIPCTAWREERVCIQYATLVRCLNIPGVVWKEKRTASKLRPARGEGLVRKKCNCTHSSHCCDEGTKKLIQLVYHSSVQQQKVRFGETDFVLETQFVVWLIEG